MCTGSFCEQVVFVYRKSLCTGSLCVQVVFVYRYYYNSSNDNLVGILLLSGLSIGNVLASYCCDQGSILSNDK